tara:strand:+ start:2159 stop:2647 length:489 start_codon:yes stop_codon:yes gene_type:complete
MEKEQIEINNSWSLWIHELNNKNWDNQSYKKIFDCENLYDYNILKKTIKTQNLQNCMYFFMREDIIPMWEDPENRLGCCISFKVPLKDIKSEWDKLLLKIISEDIHINIDDFNKLNGISISPKKEFNIIKLWYREEVKSLESVINGYENYVTNSNSRIKKHF